MSSITDQRTRSDRWLTAIERILIMLGLILLGLYIAARIESAVVFRAALRELKENKPSPATHAPESRALLPSDSSPASRAPSGEAGAGKSGRHVRYRTGTPLALLRIPKLKLEAPVLEGIDAVTLNSGVGRIPGTAFPGEAGNLGIAGHRDGFFEGLKNINKGDVVELTVKQKTNTYVVDMIEITSPDDISVLHSSTEPELTLVTCYPFRFIGRAPRRFIVHASLKK